MQFEWDEQKNTLNIQKHGIDFTDTYELFEQPILVLKDARKDYKESCYIGMVIFAADYGNRIYST
ncbi:MAG: BrnT family toxin [Pseudomonadota bacterium]